MTNASDIRGLTPEQAASGLPARLQGRVTFFSADMGQLFIEDGSGGIAVFATNMPARLRPGERVLVEGTVTGGALPGVRLPHVGNARVEVRPGNPVLMPSPMRIDEIDVAKQDGNLLEVSGVVRSTRQDTQGRHFEITEGRPDGSDGKKRLHVVVLGVPPTNYTDLNWIGVSIRARGVCTWDARPPTNTFSGVQLLVGEWQLMDGQPRTLDWMDIPIATADELNRGGFVRVQGILDRIAGGVFTLRGEGREITVRRRGLASPADRRDGVGAIPGDRLDVLGFARERAGRVLVTDALLQIVGRSLQTNLPPDAAVQNYLPLLTDASAVRALSKEEADRKYPVRLNSVVTYHDWDTNLPELYVQDQGHAGIFVLLNQPVATNLYGMAITVTGTSAPGKFAPIVNDARFEAAGPATLPRPARVSLEMIMTGQQDSQLIEISGVVRAVKLLDRHLYIDLMAGAERFTVVVPGWDAARPVELVDSRLRVRGVCATLFNDARQMIGFRLCVAQRSDLEIEENPSPAGNSPRPIASVMNFNTRIAATHRVNIRGTVTAALVGKRIVVRDTNASIMVQLTAGGDFRRGDLVDVVGFPKWDLFKPSLEDASATVLDHGATVRATALKASELVGVDGRTVVKRAERYDAELVTMAAILESRFRRDVEEVLVLRQQSRIFYAFVACPPGSVISQLEEGSELLLTGICQLPRTTVAPTTMLRLLVETPKDVRIIRSPSWWNAQRVMLLLMAVGLLLLVIAGWAALLRRQVTRRTSELALANKQLHQQIAHSGRVAESLAATEARQRAIIDAEPDCVMVLEPGGAIAEINRAGLHMIGASESARGQTNLLDLAHDSARANLRGFLGAALAGRTHAIEFEIASLTGEHRWVDLRAAPLRNGQGDVTHILALMRDVSVRRQNDNELQLKTAVLENIAEAMTSYLASRNWRQAATLLLRAAQRVTASECGFTGILASGGVLRVMAYEGAQWQCAGEAAANALQQYRERGFFEISRLDTLFGRAVVENRVIVANDGEQQDAVPPGHPAVRRFLGVPIRVGTEVVGILALANRAEPYTDLEQQQVEHLSRIGGLLYDNFRRSEREGALQAQLRQAQKMEAIGQLAAGVAHDFNNLLTIIRGRAELLTLLVATGPAAEAGREISGAAERAANLTRQLLTFSRKQPLQLAMVDLNTVIQNLSRMLHRLLREDISIQLHFGAALPPIFGDAGMIEQVILNLAVNARDAMPSGGSLIIETQAETVNEKHVREQPQARVGEFICLVVSDTGVGMTPEVMAHIFEPFFTTKDVGKGTGLGLATVYGIIQQHHGWVEVTSTPGRGTSFRLYFAAEAQRGQDAAETRVREATLAGDETILVVEDEPGVRELVRGILQRFGYRVVMAQSGLDALGAWESAAGEIDLLMTDMVMPEGISGLDLAQRLLRRKASLRVIFTSGYSVQMSEIESQLRPGVEFLPKPYEVQKLAECVRRCLDAKVTETA